MQNLSALGLAACTVQVILPLATPLATLLGDSHWLFSLSSPFCASYRCNELCTRSYPLHRKCNAGKSVMDTHRQRAFSFWLFVVVCSGRRGEGVERGKWGWGNNWGRRECASPVINASTHRVKWRQMVCLSSVHCLFIHQIVLLLPLLLALAAVGQIHTHTHTHTYTRKCS